LLTSRQEQPGMTTTSAGEMANTSQAQSSFLPYVRYGLYPLLWALLMASFVFAWHNPDQLQAAQLVKGGIMLAVLLGCEWFFPYQRRWSMSRSLFFKRDLVFLIVNGGISRLLGTAFALLAVYVSSFSSGPMSGAPIWLQVIVGLCAFEAIQYPLHRLMHQSRGPLTHFLWRAHAIHHLPKQLYVVMHAVLHPINSLATRAFVIITPIALLGYDPFAVFVFMSIIALHGTVSHFNVDMRIGWFNYLFVGPELHRYHHSANSHEAVNYAGALAFFDIAFGSFLYRPGTPPEHLGLSEEDGYPAQIQPVKALLFPLHTGAVQAVEAGASSAA
jgi:sterol desaturase/sphingolipid hydroxylase (fatty acid hydroxylase superfamily)